MGHVLRAGTQLEDGKNFGEGIDGQPEPEHLCGAAQPGAQFVQLEVREPEMAEEALVQGLGVLASTSQPGGDGGLSIAEDTLGRRRIQPFGQRRSAPLRPGGKEFSDGTKECRVGQLKVVRQA